MVKQFILVSVGLFVFASAGYAQQVNVSWKDNSTNEKGFELERGPAQAGPFSKIADIAENVEAYQDATITKDALFCYRIRAWNEKIVNSQPERQFSGYSNTACAMLTDPPGDPTELQLSEAQEAIGRAQEQLGIAQTKIAQAQKGK